MWETKAKNTMYTDRKGNLLRLSFSTHAKFSTNQSYHSMCNRILRLKHPPQEEWDPKKHCDIQYYDVLFFSRFSYQNNALSAIKQSMLKKSTLVHYYNNLRHSLFSNLAL